MVDSGGMIERPPTTSHHNWWAGVGSTSREEYERVVIPQALQLVTVSRTIHDNKNGTNFPFNPIIIFLSTLSPKGPYTNSLRDPDTYVLI
jgi:hypothetical protein